MEKKPDHKSRSICNNYLILGFHLGFFACFSLTFFSYEVPASNVQANSSAYSLAVSVSASPLLFIPS